MPILMSGHSLSQDFMADSLTHATRTAEFEDGLKGENQPEVTNVLQKVHSKLEINTIIYSRGRVDQVPPWADKIPILQSSVQFVAST